MSNAARQLDDIGRPQLAVVTAHAPQSKAIPAEGAVPFKAWLAVLGSTLGAFMAVLNIQITNAALPDIQGAIGAGIDDGGWISTAYLITEIIVIPLSGWLARVFSLRVYLLASSALFLLFSVLCAFAQDLGQMIVLRALQGFTGGVLIPLAFTIIMILLPKGKQPVGMALFAISATFAPAIGPTIGGFLNDNYGWQYIFYVNLAPGALMLAMLWVSLETAPMQLSLFRRGDWAGIVAMAVGLGSLQTLLEEGNKDDWFGSPFIVRLAVLAAVSLSVFLWIELRSKSPLLNLRLLRHRNFGLGTLANFLLGIALYGSVFVLPLYLSLIQGYNAEQIGKVLAWTGIPQLAIIPLVPRLMKRFDPRALVAVGFGLFSLSTFMTIGLSGDFSGPQFFWPNVIRAVGQALVLAPLSAIAAAGIDKDDAGSASSLFNMMRNLGGAFGIAGLQTLLTKREQFHSNVLSHSVSQMSQATHDRIANLTRYFLAHGANGIDEARREAIITVGRVVRRQAFFMGYGDTFFVLGVALLVALIATLFLRKGPGAAAGH